MYLHVKDMARKVDELEDFDATKLRHRKFS